MKLQRLLPRRLLLLLIVIIFGNSIPLVPCAVSATEVPVRRNQDVSTAMSTELGPATPTIDPIENSISSAILSAQSSMNIQPQDISAFGVFRTAAPSSVVASVSVSGIQWIQTTAPPEWFTVLPSDVQDIFLSRQSVLRSIETEILGIQATKTKNMAEPKATGLIALEVVVVGVIGVVVVL